MTGCGRGTWTRVWVRALKFAALAGIDGKERLVVSSSHIEIVFHDGILELLRGEAQEGVVIYPLTRRASIKDILEALGIPHTEVGRIVAGGTERNFHFIPVDGETIEVYPFTSELSVDSPTVLRPDPIFELKFLVDTNALKLARNLRMAGLDAEIVSAETLLGIAEEARRENRILLTRNRDLLKISIVIFGQLLRSENHVAQLSEVIDRYGLGQSLQPFSRCLSCNGLLEAVAKEAILDRLEPLTRKYYTDFKECARCRKIFWRGSHHERMLEMLGTLTG